MNEAVLPVLVVGAGPTGLMVANELARHGFRRGSSTADPRRRRHPAHWSSSPGPWRSSTTSGVIDQAIAAGNPATGLTITFAKKTVELDFAGQLTGPQNYTAYPEPRTLSQHDTERILTELLSKQGVEIERGRALTDLTQDGEAVTVSLRGEDGSIETCDAGGSSAATARTARCERRQASRSPGPRTATSSSWPMPNSIGSCRTAGYTDFPVLQEFSRHSRCQARTATGSSATSRQDRRAQAPSTANPATKSSRRWSTNACPSRPRSSRSTG